MKKLFFIFSFLCVSICSYSVNVFINKQGNYVLFNENTDIVSSFIQTNEFKKGSFRYYTRCLGYKDNEIISNFEDKYAIGINSFNNEVIFIIIFDDNIKYINQDIINNKYLNNYKFESHDFISNLDDGIKNKSISLNFVKSSLNITDNNGIIIDNIHGFKYKFINGILVEYTNNTGLNKNSLYIKNRIPSIYNKIIHNSKEIYNEINVEYINGQSDYFCNINTDYLKLASNPNINYNYCLLYCIIYGKGVSLEMFNKYVPGAEIYSNTGGYLIMSYNNFMFVFKNGQLVKI